MEKNLGLARMHQATTFRTARQSLKIFSIDHSVADLASMVTGTGASRLPAFKTLAVEAALEVAAGRPAYGMFLDGDLGCDALIAAEAGGLWVARQFPHDRADNLADNPAANPGSWPATQVVKVIASARSGARTPLSKRMPELQNVASICRAKNRQLMVEALATNGAATVDLMDELYRTGLKPDWWLIEPLPTATEWQACANLTADRDPLCRGIIVIARTAQMTPELALAARQSRVEGFVAGRALFGPVLAAWLAGQCSDVDARRDLATAYRTLADAWQQRKDSPSV